MKILVIESSPHKNGSSNLLADHFIRGAKEAGHTISTFDAAKASLLGVRNLRHGRPLLPKGRHGRIKGSDTQLGYGRFRNTTLLFWDVHTA